MIGGNCGSVLFFDDVYTSLQLSIAFLIVIMPYVDPDCGLSHLSLIRPDLRNSSSIFFASLPVQNASCLHRAISASECEGYPSSEPENNEENTGNTSRERR